jgi:hypothetical protein
MARRELVRKIVALSVGPVFATVAFFGASPAVNAGTTPVTFAQAFEDPSNSNANAFEYFDNGAGSDAEFGTSDGTNLGVKIPIDFTFLSVDGALPPDLTNVQLDATLSMTSSTKGIPGEVQTAFAGAFADQKITGGGTLINQIKITLDTPYESASGPLSNLLTVTFVGDLAGPVGGNTPDLNADTAVTGDSVTYTSDFLNFSTSNEEGFNLALSSWDPLVTPPNGLSVDSADQYYNSATAAGAATFDFTGTVSAIPEPAGTATFLAAGIALVFGCGRRLRSTASRTLASAM